MPEVASESMSAEKLAACSDFFGAAAGRLRENLEMLLGQPLTMEVGDVAAQEDAAVRVSMPVTGAACQITRNGVSDPCLLMLEPALAQTLLGLCRMAPAEDVAKARKAAQTLKPADLTDMLEVSNFFAAALSDEAQARGKDKAAFEAGPVISIEDSTWKDGEDPLSSGIYVTAQGTIKIGDQPESDPFQLIFPISSLQALVPEVSAGQPDDPPADSQAAASAPSPTDAPESAGPSEHSPAAEAPQPAGTSAPAPASLNSQQGAAVVCLAPAARTGELQEALAASTTFVEQASALLQILEGQAAPDLLIAQVGRDEDHLLRLLSALKMHPAIRQRPLMVLLEHPTVRRVLRCGQLGLFNVLPDDAAPELIRQRSARLLALGA